MALKDFEPIDLNGLILPCKCLHYKYINGFYVPCGKCEFCMRNRAREWAFRLEAEANVNFVYNCLLTYDDVHLPYYNGEPSLNKVHIQLFLKRLRYYIEKEFGCKVKYYLCAEYGGKKHRPHYHMILLSEKKLVTPNFRLGEYHKIQELLDASWSYGLADIEPMENVGGSVRYLTQYMTNYSDGRKYDKHNKPFFMMSRCGLGKNWIDEHPELVKVMKEEMDYTYKTRKADGSFGIVSIPRYLRRKITDEAEQIARADKYYEYSNNFKNNIERLKDYEQARKLRFERKQQQIREREQYRKRKIHVNNTATSQLSCRVASAKQQETS